MKILVYTDYYKQKSGYATEFRNILPYFRSEGHEVAHVALGYNGFPIEEGMRVYPGKVTETKSHWAPEVLQYAVDDFDPDIVFTIQDYYVLQKIAFEMAHPGRFKWVHWGLADGEPLDFTAIEPSRWVHQHIFHTQFAKDVMKQAVPEVDGPVIYPPVDTNIFKKLNKLDLRRQFKLEGKKIILNVARPQLRKNLPILLEAFMKVLSDIPEAILILAVAASNKPLDPLFEDALIIHDMERFVPRMGLSNHVLMPKNKEGKPIDDETLNIQYNLADVNVLTSWGEGFGLPIIEAGAVGVPSIGVDCSAMTEVIGQDRGLLVKPRAFCYTTQGVRQYLVHPSDIASALVTMLRDENLGKKCGNEAYNLAQTLSPESRAKEILQVFEDVIKNDVQPIVKR